MLAGNNGRGSGSEGAGQTHLVENMPQDERKRAEGSRLRQRGIKTQDGAQTEQKQPAYKPADKGSLMVRTGWSRSDGVGHLVRYWLMGPTAVIGVLVTTGYCWRIGFKPLLAESIA